MLSRNRKKNLSSGEGPTCKATANQQEKVEHEGSKVVRHLIIEERGSVEILDPEPKQQSK